MSLALCTKAAAKWKGHPDQHILSCFLLTFFLEATTSPKVERFCVLCTFLKNGEQAKTVRKRNCKV